MGAQTNVTPNGAGTAQVDKLTLTGDYTENDVISITNATGTSTLKYTVVAADVVAGNAATTRTNIAAKLATAAGALATTGSFAALSRTTATAANGEVTFTAATAGTANGAFGTLAVAKGSTTGLMKIEHANISTQADSNAAIGAIDATLGTVNTARAEMGAIINRLNYAGDNLTNISQNASESRSRILDTDYAIATTELARTQIISQAATAMLAQANQASQSVLSLLR
jgi:flagellin